MFLFFGGHERKLPHSPPQTIRWFLLFIQGFWFSSSRNGPTFQKHGGMKRRESKNDLGPQQGLSVKKQENWCNSGYHLVPHYQPLIFGRGSSERELRSTIIHNVIRWLKSSPLEGCILKLNPRCYSRVLPCLWWKLCP